VPHPQLLPANRVYSVPRLIFVLIFVLRFTLRFLLRFVSRFVSRFVLRFVLRFENSICTEAPEQFKQLVPAY